MATLEYDKIYSEVLSNRIESHNLYNDLLKKEKVVLDTINKVVNQKERKVNKFTNMSINQIFSNTIDVLKDILVDVNNKKNIDVILQPKRRLYIGICLTFISILIILLYKSDV